MSKRNKYSNEPIQAEVVRDFLPSPDEPAGGEEGVKITISLSRRSVDLFKAAAEHNHTSYQRMIRRLLDAYADQYQDDLTRRFQQTLEDSRRWTLTLASSGLAHQPPVGVEGVALPAD